MSAKDTVRRNKTAIVATLSGDRMLILNKVHENNLITDREYKNLKSIEKEDVEGHVVGLVDKLMNKGEKSCNAFLKLLQTDEEIKVTYPELESMRLNDTCILPTPVQASSVDDSDGPPPEGKRTREAVAQEADEHHLTRMKLEKLERQIAQLKQGNMPLADYYALKNEPRGLCVVINNEDFQGLRLKNRKGTQQDVEALSSVFTRLGFTVLVHKNLTAEDMRQELQKLGSRNFLDEDALVVCVLSHGELECVFGTDEQQVSLKELTRPFTSRLAPTLAGKPKLFFIQACQGSGYQTGAVPCPPKPRQEEVVRQSLEEVVRQSPLEEVVRQSLGEVVRQSPLEEAVRQSLEVVRKSLEEVIRQSPLEEVVRQSTLEEVVRQSPLEEVVRQSTLEEVVRQSTLEEVIRQSPLEEVVRQSTLEEVIRQSPLEEVVRQSTLEADAGVVHNVMVACEADMLLGMATVPECHTFRNVNTGSIYIQELCKQLRRSAESLEKDDILTVLTRVNREVGKGQFFNYKQMPMPKYTLTKKLVLKYV